MTPVIELLSRLRSAEITLSVQAGQLRVLAPPGALTTALREEIAAKKREIVKLLDELQGRDDSMIARADRTGDLPLSFAQERLWLVDQLEPETAAYNVPIMLRLHGLLNVPLLSRCLNAVIRRHEALRTHFKDVDGRPAQVIDPPQDQEMPVVDLSQLPEADRQSEVRRLCEVEAQRPFVLIKDSLLRVTLFRLGPAENVLMLVAHHIASDGWSLWVLVNELALLYEAFEKGNPSPLPEPAIQYVDFTVWQRGWFKGGVLERQRAYWKNQLAGNPALLELPRDRLLSTAKKHAGALEVLEVPATLVDSLKALSQQGGATLFMTLLAAFETLLHRYTGQEDISVGSPIAGRTRAELEGLIGFFVNTLVLRGDLSGDPPFRVLLQRVRETTLGAYAHQDLPFEKLVSDLQPERRLSQNPLFQVMFALQNMPKVPSQFGGLGVTLDLISNGTAKFDLSLLAREHSAGLTVKAEYRSGLFDRETIRRLMGHYLMLLEAVVANPDRRLSELLLLTEADRQQLLVIFNQTQRDYPRDKSVHEMFEEQARRTPGAVAVVFENEKMTYLHLDKRSNQLAHHLRALGVGPETSVALCAKRSLEMVVGLLGILKAGGVYVPLDPDYPAERLAIMLADSRSQIVLTQAAARQRIPGTATVFCLDTDWEKISGLPDQSLKVNVNGDNLAYITYTSGSTGEPKGVAIPHRGVVRLVKGTDYVTFSEKDVFLHLAPLAFDASTFEIWGPLLNGGRVVVMPPGQPTLKDIGEAIGSHSVTTLFLTTALFHAMVDERVADFKPLRQLLTGGEVLSVSRVQQAFEELPDCRLMAVYGPTESTTFASFCPIGENTRWDRSIPIGRPIANTQLFVLDKRLEPAAIGIPGEIYIGGDGLAREYLNKPQLTAEKFIPNRFSTDPKARLYKTGDLARYLPDGNIEFLGRVDDQVKIRGFRVELGEIETVLGQHPSVQEATVMAREDTPGDKRLVAYVVSRNGAPSADELRTFLRAKLPEYLVPAAFVTLDKLPLTRNGKVNRRALPPPDYGAPPEKFVAPSTPTEIALREIWRNVLGWEKIGIHDNFFDVGGHSLLAVRIVAAIQRKFGRTFPLGAVFNAPTIFALARLLDQEQSGSEAVKIPLRPVDHATSLSFAQERLWFLDQLEPGTALYNVPMAFRLKGALEMPALQRCLTEIVGRHEALRTRYEAIEGQPQQIIQPIAPVEAPFADLSALPGPAKEAKIKRICAVEAQRPFDLARDVMLRARIFRMAEDEHVLFINMHHIASDGWSVDVLENELSELYAAFSKGAPSPLPALPIQYADYAVWQRDRLQGEILETQLAYWKKQLEGAPSLLELATDRPRPAKQGYRGAIAERELPEGLAGALRQLSQAEGATLFMTLLAGFQTLLHRYSGVEDIVAGSPIAGRNQPEVSSLIGFFVNMLVLRADFSEDPTFRRLLARTRETALGAYAHQDMPFEQLVKALQPKADTSHFPLVQVVFALQGAKNPFEMGPLKVSRMPIDGLDCKFDLSLSVVEEGMGLRAVINYKTDLFEAETIERMLGHYQALLEGIVANPDQRVSEVPLMSAPERRKLLENGGHQAQDRFTTKCVHEMFEEQAAKSPDAVALTCESRSLTYRELNEQANRLAHYLIKNEVGPETLVGLCVERSPELIVGLLGILKAGAAYVPLDPAYPKDRLDFMLEDAKPKVLLTQKRLIDLLSTGAAKVIALDSANVVLGGESTENPRSGAGLENLAYIIYTSGSTGRPKGTMVTHRNVSRLLGATNDWFHFTPADRWTFFHSHAFDFSVWEIWGALAYGGRLVVVPYWVSRSPSAFLELLDSEKVTVLNQTPSAFRQLVEADLSGQDRDLALRLVIFGGEALEMQTLAPWFERHGDQRPQLVNMYGITETTVHVTYRPLKSGDLKSRSVIGVPIPDLELYVVDRRGQLVPPGVAGELYVGGAGVARGYLNRPELSREKFIDNPFSDKPGARVYRSGDLVRWLPDGDLEYLGRIDQQVKIRGFRIELGEIESVLSAIPEVRDAVVMAREDTPGDKRLVAYVVSRSGAVDSAQLRDFLRARLPDYMVPAAYVSLPKLPLTQNGKIDRGALPKPDYESGAGSFASPVTPMEITLAEIWREVLGVEKVGLNDSFFDLGGHSLLAIRLCGKIKSRTALDVPIHQIFQRPTIGELAKYLASEDVGKRRSQLVKLQQGSRRPEVFFLVDDGSLNLFKLGRLMGEGWPVYASVCLLPEDKVRASVKREYHKFPTLAQMAEQHVALIQGRQSKGPIILAGHCFGGMLAFEAAHQLQKAGQEVAAVLLLDTWMNPPGWFWWKRTWLAAHASRILRQGPGYLWRKSARRLNLHKERLASRLRLAIDDDFTTHVPWPIIERICRHAMDRYKPRPLATLGFLLVSKDDWASNAFRKRDNTLGGAAVFTGGVDVCDVMGDHVTILDEPHLPSLAQSLQDALARLEAAQFKQGKAA